MTHTEILTAIYTKLSTATRLPAIAYPNVAFDTTNKSEWLQVFIMPLPTETFSFGAGKDKGGLIQINCVVKINVGELAASRIADKILELFPIKSNIATGLKVDKEPYASAGMKIDDNLYVIAVTVTYRLLEN